MEMDEDLEFLRRIQNTKVKLNVEGARFETSHIPVWRDPNSLLAKLFKTESSIFPGVTAYFWIVMPHTLKSSLIIYAMIMI